MCQQIATLYKARDANVEAIVVWIDRERRADSAETICGHIREALEEAGAPSQKVHILVADLMTENIILADEHYVRSTFGLGDYTYSLEGVGEKSRLKEMFSMKGENYKETRHGVRCLKAIRLERCARASPSVSSFLNTFTQSCWWISHEDAAL